MSVRTAQWILDSGVLAAAAIMNQFNPGTVALATLSLAGGTFTPGIPANGTIAGTTAGSTLAEPIFSAGFGFSINPGALTWAYDGSGAAGSFIVLLAEILDGTPNSPNITALIVTVAAAIAGSTGVEDFSQNGNPLADGEL